MIKNSEAFHAQFPKALFFDENNLHDLPHYLLEKALISHEEKVLSIEKPGEGNMNFVKRITTDKQSLILKQSRPWVEKYPQIVAPVERIEAEASFYQFILKASFLHDYSPDVLLYDPANFILITEDLGKGSDFTFCYKKAHKIHTDQLVSLLKYISHLHNIDWDDQKNSFPSNILLKQLNHEHIFKYPYMVDNGLDLDTIQPGLQQLALSVKKNTSLKKKLNTLGEKYLASGPVLIHGDYYPGSWLQVGQEVKVIDPEFAYFGYAEFDVAVLTAHLLMSGMNLTAVKKSLNGYDKRKDFDNSRLVGFCGAEILRRIIGLAQLPLELTLSEKSNMIELAINFINSPKNHQLL